MEFNIKLWNNRLLSSKKVVVVSAYLFLIISYSCSDEDVKGNLPTLASTTVASNITTNSAESGGTITSDGGTNITARGVCWSTLPNPTINDSKTVDAAGTGVFQSSITALQSGTTYYARAYATNGAGTAYAIQITFMTIPVIGQELQGGKVAYVLADGDIGYDALKPHGIIVAPSDLSTGISWGCSGSTTGATGISVGTGNQNTASIIAACAEAGIAARLCSDLVLNGYSDWYLPSQEELVKVYNSRNITGGFNTSGLFYWSSTEYSSTTVNVRRFSDGVGGTTGKGSTAHLLRAVRSF